MVIPSEKMVDRVKVVNWVGGFSSLEFACLLLIFLLGCEPYNRSGQCYPAKSVALENSRVVLTISRNLMPVGLSVVAVHNNQEFSGMVLNSTTVEVRNAPAVQTGWQVCDRD